MRFRRCPSFSVLILVVSFGLFRWEVAAQVGGQAASAVREPSLASLAGDYETTGQRVEVRLRADGVLTLATPRAMPRQPVRELIPLGNLRFAQQGLPDQSIEFMLDPAGNIRGLMLRGPNWAFFRARLGGVLDTPTSRASPPASPTQPPVAPSDGRGAAAVAPRGQGPVSRGAAPAAATPSPAAASTVPAITYQNFKRPRMVQVIYENAFDDVTPAEWDLLLSYLFGVERFTQTPPCTDLADQTFHTQIFGLEAQVGVRVLSGPVPMQTHIATQDAARDDIARLASSYGPCSGAVVKRFYDNGRRYVAGLSSKQVLSPVATLERACVDNWRTNVVPKRFDGGAMQEGETWCACLAPRFRDVQLSNADWHALRADFVSAQARIREASTNQSLKQACFAR